MSALSLNPFQLMKYCGKNSAAATPPKMLTVNANPPKVGLRRMLKAVRNRARMIPQPMKV